MIVKIARYHVRKESVADAATLVRAYVDEVTRKEGGTARYEAYQDVADPTRFTHIMAFRTPSAEDYHGKTAWSKAFMTKLTAMCVEPPVSVAVNKLEKE